MLALPQLFTWLSVPVLLPGSPVAHDEAWYVTLKWRDAIESFGGQPTDA